MLGKEASQPVSNEALILEASGRARDFAARDPAFSRNLEAAEVLAALEAERSSGELFLRACALYADRPALAYREPGDGAFIEITYGELGRRVARLAAGFQREGLVARGDHVALLAFGGPEFLIAEMALVLTGATAVPLQTGLESAALQAVLSETRARAVVCDRDQLVRVTALLGACPAVRSVIALSYANGSAGAGAEAEVVRAESAARASDVRCVTLHTLATSGAEAPGKVTPAELGPDPLRMIVYTSGSTGTPKGALFPESVYVQKWRPARARSYPFLPGFPLPLPICSVFSPLSHQMGSELLAAALMRGALTYLSLSGGSAHLFEDLRRARPTFIGFVPRVANQIYDDFKFEVARRSARSEDAASVERVRAEVMREMRATYLGDRLLAATSGSALIAAPVLAFLRECFCVPVYDMMGMTETGGFLFDGRIRRDNVLDFQLVDAEESGFRTSDRPYPRGELLLRTRRQVRGYFQSPDATRATFTEDGYVRTGDIFEQHDAESIRWIARKNQTKKLAHGKFVNLTELEATFARESEIVHQLYLCAESERSYLLGVLVPNSGVLRQRLGTEVSATSESARELLRRELLAVGRRSGLKAWEIPRDFVVEPTPFTRENGLVADNGKILPARLAAKYGPALAALDERLEQEQKRRLVALDAASESGSLADKVRLALGAVVNPSLVHEGWLDFGFSDLGGDSISAMTFVALLARQWQLKLPVALVLDRAAKIGDLVRYLEESGTEGGDARASFESLHAPAQEQIFASDFGLEKLGLTDVSPRRASPAVTTGGARTVLLTGASGFLGRFLVLDLLGRASRDVDRVVALVRARDAAAGRDRIVKSVASDPELATRMAELCRAGRLEVVASDLIAPRLGLSATRFAELADTVDTVVHAGALVNHALGYDELFEPNVLGSAEVARLACTGRAKSILFVSTVGLAEGLARTTPVLESERASALWSVRDRREPMPGYGYTTSKWAGELLLQSVAERHGVPVVVVRCGNLMAHERARGQINADDFLSRLVCGLVYTGIAPASFYRMGAEPGAFDGVPVDGAASIIADLALAPTQEAFRVFQLVAPPVSGALTLDTITDAVKSYGFPLERVADHASWYRALSERLERLEEPRRSRSPLPLLARFRAPLSRSPRMDSSELRARVAELRGLSAFAFPKLGESFVHKCLNDLTELGVFR